MRDETISIHTGYETDPTTKSVAVPIHQTVAYEFDDAQHGADLFDLAVPGNIYSRIMNPTNDALEKKHRCWLRMEYWLEWKLEMLWEHRTVIQNEVQMVHVLEQRLEQLMDHEVDRSDPVGSFGR